MTTLLKLTLFAFCALMFAYFVGGIFFPEQPEAKQAITEVSEVVEMRAAMPGLYYSGSIAGTDTGWLKRAGVARVIRLNGDTATDNGGVSTDTEAAFLRRAGIDFKYCNIEGDFSVSIPRVLELIEGSDGVVLVHCKNGRHRAPFVAGMMMKKYGYYMEDIIDAINWTDFAKSPGKYARYVDYLKQ